MKKFVINIPSPCHEPWDEMQPQRFGKFCSSCQKIVVDFSNATDSEITRHLAAHPNTCGRFRTSQLQKTYSYTAHTTAFLKKKWFYFLGFLYAELIAPNAKAQNKPLSTSHIYLAENTNKDSGHLLKGIVKDDIGVLMPFVNIIIKGTDKSAVTDVAGEFSIQVSDKDTLIVSFISYKTQEIVAGSASLINIILHEDVKVLDEVIATGYSHMKRTVLTGGQVAIMPVSRDTTLDSTHVDKSVCVSKKRSFFKRLFGIK